MDKVIAVTVDTPENVQKLAEDNNLKCSKVTPASAVIREMGSGSSQITTLLHGNARVPALTRLPAFRHAERLFCLAFEDIRFCNSKPVPDLISGASSGRDTLRQIWRPHPPVGGGNGSPGCFRRAQVPALRCNRRGWHPAQVGESERTEQGEGCNRVELPLNMINRIGHDQLVCERFPSCFLQLSSHI